MQLRASQLKRYPSPEIVPGQEGGTPRRVRFDLRQTNWSPAARLLVSCAGTTLAAYGARRRDPIGLGAAAVGLTMLVRALTNLPVQRWFGPGGRERRRQSRAGRRQRGQTKRPSGIQPISIPA